MTTRRLRLTPRYLFEVVDGGTSFDITEFIVSAQWRWGSRLSNDIGGIVTPASGLITIDNTDGSFSPLSDSTRISTLPGPKVRIWVQFQDNRVILLFSGWSMGILEGNLINSSREVTMPLEGALARIAGRNSRLRAPFSGNLFSGAIVHNVLNFVGWPQTLRDIDPGTVALLEFKAQGITNGGMQFLDTLSRLDLIMQAEGGRLYDDYRSFVVFEQETKRIAPKIATTFDESIISSHIVGSPSENIINSIVAENNEIQILALQQLDNAFKAVPPFTYPILAGSTVTLGLEINTDAVAFVATVEQMVYGSDYTFVDSADNPILFPTPEIEIGYVPQRPLTEGVNITIRNPTGRLAHFTVLNINGTVGAASGILGVHLITPLENRESIQRYGLKPVQYPAGDLFVNIEVVRAKLQSIIDRHKGVDGVPPIQSLDISGSGTSYHQWLEARVGDDAVVSDVGGLSAPKTFHIDEAIHSVNFRAPQYHNVTLRLTGGQRLPGPQQ